MSEAQLRDGAVAPELRAEFPGLRLRHATVAGRPSASPPALVARLRELSNRDRGAGVVAMRTRPVPSAYRTFFRQIGLDPDVSRIPAEEAAVARLLHGGFRSGGLPGDACLVALIETGVPVWALDAGAGDGSALEIRVATAADASAGDPVTRPAAGTLVVADAGGVRSQLFGDPLPGHAPTARTRQMTLYAVAVDGVPDIHVEEAMWTALEAVGAPPGD